MGPARDDSWVYLAKLLAALIVVGAMAVLYHRFQGWTVPDWTGYEALYIGEGGYLYDLGRDPAFVWLLLHARDLFQSAGYDAFRLWLFVIFTVVAAWLALVMRPQLLILAPFLSATVVLAVFLLKSLVQIREGIAFLFVLVPLVGVFRNRGAGVILAGLGAGIAVALHIGTAVFLLIWLFALVLAWTPSRFLTGTAVHWLLLFGAVFLGVAMAVLVIHYSTALGFLLQDFGFDRSAEPIGGALKYAYWALLGGLILSLRHVMVERMDAPRPFGFAYASVIASGAMPALYTLCAILVFTNFYIPALTTLAERLLYSVIELALVILMLRGRGGWVVWMTAVVMIAVQARLLIATPA